MVTFLKPGSFILVFCFILLFVFICKISLFFIYKKLKATDSSREVPVRIKLSSLKVPVMSTECTAPITLGDLSHRRKLCPGLFQSSLQVQKSNNQIISHYQIISLALKYINKMFLSTYQWTVFSTAMQLLFSAVG